MKKLIILIIATMLLSSCKFINGTQYNGFYDDQEGETEKTYMSYMFVDANN